MGKKWTLSELCWVSEISTWKNAPDLLTYKTQTNRDGIKILICRIIKLLEESVREYLYDDRVDRYFFLKNRMSNRLTLKRIIIWTILKLGFSIHQ